MHRLLVATETLDLEEAVLPAEAAKHLRVLRPKCGEEIELFDGCGASRIYRAGASAAAPLVAAGEVRQAPKRPLELTLCACVTKGSRWDWTIEKAVELGASRIVPVISERCIVRLAEEERAAKRARWQRVADDAARQSDAAYVAEVALPVDFAGACAQLPKFGPCFVGALTTPPPAPLFAAVTSRRAEVLAKGGCSCFVGPEGDFSPAELEALLTSAIPTSFGPTILRAETAAIFALSVIASVFHS